MCTSSHGSSLVVVPAAVSAARHFLQLLVGQLDFKIVQLGKMRRRLLNRQRNVVFLRQSNQLFRRLARLDLLKQLTGELLRVELICQ